MVQLFLTYVVKIKGKVSPLLFPFLGYNMDIYLGKCVFFFVCFFLNSAILGNLKQLCGIFEPGAFLQYKPPQNISIKVTLLKYY